MSTQEPKIENPPADQPINGEQSLAPVQPLRGGALEVGARGFRLNTLDEAWRFCTAIAQSGLAPKGMDTPQKVLYALELGFEVGLPPLAALQSIAVINGRASLYGDVMLGLCVGSGKFDEDAFEEDWIRDKDHNVIGAYCVTRRLPNGKPRRWDFTIDDAKTAKLWGKEGPWSTTPKRMMQMRARAFCLRDVFPDVLKGIVSREEASDLPPQEPAEKNVTPAKPQTLDDLTQRLEADAPIAEVSAPPTTTSGSPPEAPIEEDVDKRQTLIASLEEARTVPDVTRIRNLWTDPKNKLLTPELTSADVDVLCTSRVEAIRSERPRKGAQPTLPTS